MHWLARPETTKRLWITFIVILALTLLVEPFVAHEGHFGIDETLGFNAWFGFLSCVALIFFAKALGVLLKRKDDYYGR